MSVTNSRRSVRILRCAQNDKGGGGSLLYRLWLGERADLVVAPTLVSLPDDDPGLVAGDFAVVFGVGVGCSLRSGYVGGVEGEGSSCFHYTYHTPTTSATSSAASL